jgi:putative ABC transport system substrate-binding protein
VRRREFITLLGGAAAWPLAARGQESVRARRVGVLMNSAATDATYQSYLAAFTEALHQLGWIEGQNLRIDVRWSAGDAALARIYAAQLIGLKPDAAAVLEAREPTRREQVVDALRLRPKKPRAALTTADAGSADPVIH